MRCLRSLCAICALVMVCAAVTEASVDTARSMMAAGRFEDALASLQGAVSEDAESAFLRGVVLAELDRDAEAERAFRDLIRRYPEYPEPYNNLAVLLAESGRFDEAVETLKGALRTHASYRTAWDNLTTIYGRLASEAYSRALNVESSVKSAPVKLVLLGDLTGAEAPAMTPVESLPGVAVAPLSGQVAQDTARPIPAEPLEEIAEQMPAEMPAEIPSEMPEEMPEGPDQAAVEEAPVAEVPVAEATIAEAAPEEAEFEEPAIEVSDASPTPGDLTALVEAWAKAWSAQRVDDYLGFYSASFEPGDGMAVSEWKEIRRSRLAAPEFIRVSVALVDFEVDADEATVTFNQSYESNTFSDLVTKSLALRREGENWKIVKETVVP